MVVVGITNRTKSCQARIVVAAAEVTYSQPTLCAVVLTVESAFRAIVAKAR